MKERTRVLLEKNQELLKHLVRNTSKNKKVNNTTDEVDKFFSEKVDVPVEAEAAIVKNEPEATLPQSTLTEHVRELSILNHFTKRAWKAKSIGELSECSRAFYSQFIENGVEFKVIRGTACGMGAFGNINVNPSTIKGIEIPTGEQSILRDTIITENAYKGPMLPSTWNNFISNRLMDGEVCPEVIALPIFDKDGVKKVILSCNIPEDYSKHKALCLTQFAQNIKGISKTL